MQSATISYVRSHEAHFRNLGSEDVNSEFTNLVLLAYKGSRGHPHSQVSIVNEKTCWMPQELGFDFWLIQEPQRHPDQMWHGL